MIKDNSDKQSDVGKEYAAFQDSISQLIETAERKEQSRLTNSIEEDMPDEDDFEAPLDNDLTAEQFGALETIFPK